MFTYPVAVSSALISAWALVTRCVVMKFVSAVSSAARLALAIATSLKATAMESVAVAFSEVAERLPVVVVSVSLAPTVRVALPSGASGLRSEE